MFINYIINLNKQICESWIKMSDKNNNNPDKKKKQKDNSNLKPTKIEVKVQK